MKGKKRKKLRKALANDERLAKQAEIHEKKRLKKTERWIGGIRPAAYGKKPLKWGHFDKLKG